MRALMVFIAFAGLLPGQTAATPAEPCDVDGVVVNSVTGEPVPRAEISVMIARGAMTSTRSDAGGQWAVRMSPCPTQIAASRPGFLAYNRMVPLSSANAAHGVKIALIPQAVVSGMVTDELSDPVPNVQVTAFGSRVAAGRRELQSGGSASTNDLGEFRIAALRAGKYLICAQLNSAVPKTESSGASTILGESCWPAPMAAGVSSAIEMPAGRETKVNFTLRAVPVVTIRGVLSPKTRGLGVMLTRRGLSPGMGTRPGAGRPDGTFEIRGVVPGSYTLSADYREGGTRLLGRMGVEVGGADVNDLILPLQSAFTLAGTIVGEAPDSPINLVLRAADPAVAPAAAIFGPDRTSFTIPGVVPGTWRLEAYGPGRYYVKRASLAGMDLSKQDVLISQSPGPLEVTMANDTGSVEGQVADASDRPAAASGVMLMQEGRYPRNVVSGADGRYRLDDVPPGQYRIFAWDEITQVEYASPEWMQRYSRGTAVTVEPGATAQVKVVRQTVPVQ